MNQSLIHGLEQLDMMSGNQPIGGLVPVTAKLNDSSVLPPEEIIALGYAEKYDVDFVYFKRFSDRPSVPQVYIFDFTSKPSFEEEPMVELHRKLYSSGRVPMFFVFTVKDIIIFNCYEKPAEGSKLVYNPLTTISLASSISSELFDKRDNQFDIFSAKSLDNGSFWENSEYSDRFKSSNGAYESLLSELKQALNYIIEQEILPPTFARKIIVLAILIKYLEERKDDEGNQVFPKGFFGSFANKAKGFSDVLRTKGAFANLLDYLANHFNGGIFKLSTEEKEVISANDLTKFAQFLDGNVKGRQFVFWRLYSFNDLPVELISNIYEEFLGRTPGVVYTPPYLVNFLLDEAMPLTSTDTDFKVLDPACGSGVFLVGAYRRLIYRWRLKNDWSPPDLDTLKDLLINNIYGVELKAEAVDLTVFSLALALCDALTPLQIWQDLKFDDMRQKNILEKNFFGAINENLLAKDFDLIIGNPPFESKLDDEARVVEARSKKQRLQNISVKDADEVSLPDNQLALLFLETSISLCKENGLLCMIQPSGPFLYNSSSHLFREVLFKKYHIPQLIDFTHISRILFGKKGDHATAAVFIEKTPSKESDVLHVTVRRTKPHKEKLYFDLESYDFHYVSFHQAINNPFIWKCNFIGGARYHEVLQRFVGIPTLGKYLKDKSKEGWAVSEGFTSATKSDLRELEKLRKDGPKEEFHKLSESLEDSFLSSLPYLPTTALTTNGIDSEKIKTELPTDKFHSKGNLDVYKAPHLLVKELIVNERFPIALVEKDLAFQRRIVGIHAQKEDLSELKKLHQRLSETPIYPFLIALKSGQYLVNKSSAIYKKDLMGLPYPKEDTELKVNPIEEILISDFSNYWLDFRRKGEKSTIATADAGSENLEAFGQLFLRILGKVHKNLHGHSPIVLKSFICYPFYFGERPNIEISDPEKFETYLSNLLQQNQNINLRITKIIRLYEGNVIYLIKPKKLRFWLKSIALRDADEVFADLTKQGY